MTNEFALPFSYRVKGVLMDAGEVIQFLTEGGSISMRTASKLMGRSPTFLGIIKCRERIPQFNTLAEIADVYGYDLLLRSRADGEETIIDPPKRVEE